MSWATVFFDHRHKVNQNEVKHKTKRAENSGERRQRKRVA